MSRSPAPRPSFPADWRWHHRHAARDLDDVERLWPGRFDLAALDREGIGSAAARYGMRATPYYLDLRYAALLRLEQRRLGGDTVFAFTHYFHPEEWVT